MRKILIIILLACSLVAEADKWYIATAANGGSDTDGDGSAAHPWLTLKHACDTVTGASFVGDTIVVGVGTFTEPAQITLGVGVSIYGAGATSIISSTFVGGLTEGTIQLSSSTEGTAGNQSISYIKMEGNVTGLVGIVVYRRSNVKIHHVTIQNFVQEGIKFHGGSGYSDEPTTYATSNEVYNCNFYTTDDGHGAIHLNGQDGIKIYDNTFTSVQRELGHDLGHIDIVEGFVKNIEIYNNTFTLPELLYDTDGTSLLNNFHIEIWDGMGGNKIYDNTFIGGHFGIDVAGHFNVKGASAFSWDIYDNVFQWAANRNYLSVGDFGSISIEGATAYLYIHNNHFKNVPVAINSSIIQTDLIQEYIYVYYNIFDNIGFASSGYQYMMRINQGHATAVTRYVYIYNNVMYGTTYQRAGVVMESTGAMSYVEIRNNIILNTTGNGGTTYGAITYWDDAGTIDHIAITNNNLYNNVDTVYYRNSKSVTNETYLGNITTDPLFISTSDFHLQSTSPCRDAGIDVSAITGGLDFHGASLYGAAYDIGAFEYGAIGGERFGKNRQGVMLKSRDGRMMIYN